MISTTEDARVQSIETEEFDDLKKYEGEFYLPLTEEEFDYFKDTEKGYISVRSRLARNSVDLDVKNPISIKQDPTYHLSGEFIGESLQNPIEISPGDEIFRVLKYKPEDRLTGEELIHQAGEIVETDPEVKEDTLQIPIENQLKLNKIESDKTVNELLEDKNQDISTIDSNYNSGGILSEFVLFETADVELPDNVFGIVEGTSLEGHTYHLNSRAIDPNYKGGIVTEVCLPEGRQPEDPPNWDEPVLLNLSLYRKTESSRNLNVDYSEANRERKLIKS